MKNTTLIGMKRPSICAHRCSRNTTSVCIYEQINCAAPFITTDGVMAIVDNYSFRDISVETINFNIVDMVSIGESNISLFENRNTFQPLPVRNASFRASDAFRSTAI
jgi:hypothetical protein